MTKRAAKIDSKIYMIQPVEGDPFVLVEIDIACPVCGSQRLQLAGHHLRTVRDVCIQAIDDYPELTRVESTIVEHYQVRGRANDPSGS